jgi:uncharacterized protein YndB with AHSA1/START domain
VADIIHEFFVKARPESVFEMFSTSAGLDKWWTKTSKGEASEGAIYHLFFSPQYDWEATVTRCAPPYSFELKITKAHPDWDGTLVGCELQPEKNGATRELLVGHHGWLKKRHYCRGPKYAFFIDLAILPQNPPPAARAAVPSGSSTDGPSPQPSGRSLRNAGMTLVGPLCPGRTPKKWRPRSELNRQPAD